MRIEKISPPSSEKRIFDFLLKTDKCYTPNTSSLILSLREYAEKIGKYAVVIFSVNGEQDVGMCGLYANRDDAYITTIGVIKDFQCMGIGSKLIDCAISHSISAKKHGIRLEVYYDNQPAIRLYEKKGFYVETRFENKCIMYMQLTDEDMQ